MLASLPVPLCCCLPQPQLARCRHAVRHPPLPLRQTPTSNITMIDIDAEQQAVESTLGHLTDALEVLGASLQPLTRLPALHQPAPAGDSAAQLSLFTICTDYIHLPPLEQARLYAALAYTLASLNHIQLSLAGDHAAAVPTAPAATHTPQQGVKRELERIKRYMMTIDKVAKEDEDATTTAESAPAATDVTNGTPSKQQSGKHRHHSKGQRWGDKRKQSAVSSKTNKHVKL